MSQVAGFDPPPPRALPIERVALGALLLAAVSLALIKIDATDTPWHLATARLAWADGGFPSFPATNTFSYTHPDHPLFQQYPIYDSLLWGVYQLGGWAGLSLLGALGWLTVLACWVHWGRGWGWALPLNLAWLIALLGLRRRFILCPDILTQIYLVVGLLLIDTYRRDGPRATWALVALVPLQWMMANTHQLFPLGLAVQGVFLTHLIVVKRWGGRWGIATEDRDRPIAPVAGILVASALVCLLTPLGTRIIELPQHTWGSVTQHRLDVAEFDLVWNRTAGSTAAIFALLIAVTGFAVARDRWQPFEALLVLVGAATCLIAIRGVPLFAALAAGTFCRNLARVRDRGVVVGVHALAIRHDPDALQPTPLARNLRTVLSSVTLLVCVSMTLVQWFGTTRALGGQEPGIGRYPTCWPTDAIATLRADPPPGRMLNLGWYSGNALILDLPGTPVFIDPRFEAYPRAFIQQAIRATRDPVALGGLIDRWRPDWIVLEVRDPEQRERAVELIGSRRWVMTHLCPLWVILVRRGAVEGAPDTGPYLARHGRPPERIEIRDWVQGRPQLLGQQQVLIARFFYELGAYKRADALLDDATPHARAFETVRLELTTCRVWRADSALRSGQYEAAIERAGKALDLIPGSPDALQIRGIARLFHGDPQAALEDLDQAARKTPDAHGLQYARGEALLLLGKPAEAETALGRAIETAVETEVSSKEATIARARFSRGRARAAQNRHADALTDYNAALVQLTSWEIQVARAASLEALERLDEALAAYELAWGDAPPQAKVDISTRRAALKKRIRHNK